MKIAATLMDKYKATGGVDTFEVKFYWGEKCRNVYVNEYCAIHCHCNSGITREMLNGANSVLDTKFA